MSNQPLHVLHVDSAREYRGGQNQVRALVAGLRSVPRLSQTVVVRRDSRLARETMNLGIDTRPVRWGGAVDTEAILGLVGVLRERCDLIHAHDSHSLQSVLVARALVGESAPLIAARRVDFPTRRPGVWRRADRIIAVSQCIRDVLIRQGIEPSRVEVVYSGIDPADLEPARAGVLRTAAGVKPGRLLVAAVGALVPHKDHATFIRAASIVAESRPGVDFAVFGEGPLHGSLQSLVSEVGLQHRFRLPGHIPETVRSLGDVDVFVMPSREEGLGTACIEAMLAGRPIVATSAGGLGELAGSAFRPVAPGCPEALAREIEILLGAAAVREEASLKAEERGRVFTAAAMVENTLGCYTQIAHRNLSPALKTP